MLGNNGIGWFIIGTEWYNFEIMPQKRSRKDNSCTKYSRVQQLGHLIKFVEDHHSFGSL